MLFTVRQPRNQDRDNQQPFTACTDENDAVLRQASLHLCVKDHVYFSLRTCQIRGQEVAAGERKL